jgi:hypothetical protein
VLVLLLLLPAFPFTWPFCFATGSALLWPFFYTLK